MSTLPGAVEEDHFLGDSRQVVSKPEVRILPAHQPGRRTSCLTEATPIYGSFALPKVAHWFMDVAKDVVQLMSLNVDWDSYGGEAIDQTTAEMALRTLMAMDQYSLPRPSVFAESAGGVGFEFRRPSAELTLVVHRSGEVSYFYEDLVNGVEKDGEGLPVGLRALAIDQ